jgi:hypothetical protein
MRTTKQTSKEKEFKEQIKEIIESLKLVNENLKRLYDNDGLLDGRLERLQQTQHTFKEIAVSNEGIKISSKQPLKDLDKILSNPKVKMFFDDCKKNSLIKNLSYID